MRRGGDPASLHERRMIAAVPKGAYYTSLVGTTVSLRYAQPSQEPDQGLFFQVAGRLRGPRRRRAVRPPVRPKAATTTRSPRRSRSSAAPSAATSRAGVARMSACSTCSSRAARRSAASTASGFGPRDLITNGRAGRSTVLGGDGGGSLPAAVHPGRPRHQRRGVRGRRLAVRAAQAPRLPMRLGDMHGKVGVWLDDSVGSRRRRAPASSGTRRWVRSASTSPRPSPKKITTRSSSSASAPRPSSDPHFFEVVAAGAIPPQFVWGCACRD